MANASSTGKTGQYIISYRGTAGKRYLEAENRLKKVDANGKWYDPVWTDDPNDAKAFDHNIANGLSQEIPVPPDIARGAVIEISAV
jgi:hypothetical protein